MEAKEHVKCLIIGSGPAGYTAAIYAARADMKPVLYQGMQPGGQLTETTDVDNFPGYPEGIDGTAMMVDLENQAKRFETDVRTGWVTAVDFSGDKKLVEIEEGKHVVSADSVIISTGASAKWLGMESETRLRLNGGGVSACAVCDGFFYRGQEVAVVGAGDSACEEASYLAKLCTKVHMLVRRDQMRASKAMQHRVMGMDNIEIHWNTETVDILGAEQVEGAKVRNNQTGEETVLPVTGFFLAIGHKPNTDLFGNYVETDQNGYIVTKNGSTSTNIEGVFACGDVQDHTYRQAITAAGSGCMSAIDAERYLEAQHT